VCSQTFDEIHRQFEGLNPEDILDLVESDEYETIRSEKSLMKHALMWSGSRDTSAQLFTALCRALGIPARLVVSLQSIPWQASVDKSKAPSPKRKFKLRSGEVLADDDSDEDVTDTQQKAGTSSADVKGKGKARALTPEIRLRKTKSKTTSRLKPSNFVTHQGMLPCSLSVLYLWSQRV
jgi:xeroderma pigmentosum group C-complementing protein